MVTTSINPAQISRCVSDPFSVHEHDPIDPFRVVFINERKESVGLFWMDSNGQPKPYGQIEAGQRKRQMTRPGAVWMLTDDNDKTLGYFVVDDRAARAIVPSE